ncbi:hypothetical protein O6H91_11G046100 [Diphasiastrum complanatum]|uniref:Uncharacterized protein n=2 Tax=Diphasiastrum complanatum TaxID=34168 RepID=A0ACC2C8N8_DIPCM|nr:hypothetical protein O6H91_11G046100 [Diphasiastrum complanatum]KAJ7538392.1 hypothetical protein O6H91_11G046100 [Diphasiastrum complanatum]
MHCVCVCVCERERERERERRVYLGFEEGECYCRRAMAVRFTFGCCPGDAQAQEGCGVPWGATITPFAAVDETGSTPAFGKHAQLVPRCESCWAYINALCEMEQWAWTCALCGNLNALSASAAARYAPPHSCPELTSSFVDLELDADGPEAEQNSYTRPVYIAAVDLSASEEFLELVKSALLAALEAIDAGALFGLMTFSHKMGLYDVQGPIPVVKHIIIPADVNEKIAVNLENVMPAQSFLAPVATNREHIAAALETLKPTSSWERATAAGQGGEGVPMGGRGFGVAMDALIDYLSAEQETAFTFARVLAFISGAPDYGAGQLDTRRYGEQYASKGEDADKALLCEQTPFYRNIAAMAVQAGICVDMFAITNEYIDLASLRFLSLESGGSLFLYSDTDETTLPQDLYRMLSRPCAINGVLRLRTSPEFKAARVYGHYSPDPQYENIQHIICCDAYGTLAYDFEFTDSTGFSRNFEAPPMIQLAFQYTRIMPLGESDLLGSTVSSEGEKFSIKRRLRIRTMSMGVAKSFKDIYESTDSEVVLSILTHKIIEASLEEGVREGRLLLHDWLVILTAQYNEFYKLAQFGQPSTFSRLDAAFSKCPRLQPLPRLAFALLRSSLLRLHEEGVHPDYRVYLQSLFSALEPSYLLRAIYPVLSSYSTPDKQAYPRHSLSRAAIITSGSPIFFLDAFTILIVYYLSTADPALPFPPPQNCFLRDTINNLKQTRHITPKLLTIRGGHDNVEPFERYLIEEQDVNGAPTGMGFVSFLDQIGQDVVRYMK